MNMISRARPVVFGEVLFDCFPDGSSVLGGAPFNVAWHLQAFGAEPLMVTRVGDDALGAAVTGAMGEWGMDLAGVQVDAQRPTGTVEVRFEEGEPSYRITEGVAWDAIDAAALPSPGAAGLLYHGSLALRAGASRRAWSALCASLHAPRFMDVNLRAPWWDPGEVRAWARGAAWVKLNADELERLDAREREDGEDGRDGEAFRRGCAIGRLVVTRGARGALVLDDDGRHEDRPVTAARVVDTVGAGDAFASVLLLGAIEGWDTATTLARAQDFASAIVGVRGATVREAAFYAPFRSAWSLA